MNDNDFDVEFDSGAEIFIENDRLVIAYGSDRTIVMDIEDEKEREIVEDLLNDINLWTSFLNSLSAALKQIKEQK